MLLVWVLLRDLQVLSVGVVRWGVLVVHCPSGHSVPGDVVVFLLAHEEDRVVVLAHEEQGPEVLVHEVGDLEFPEVHVIPH